MLRVDLGSNRQRGRQPLLDRGHHPGLHLRGGVPVAEADRAALAPAAVAAGVAHEFVDHPGGDAGVLQPGREGVPQVVGAAQLEVVESVIARGVGRRPARRLAVAYLLSGRQAGLLQLPERIVDGAEGRAAAGDSAADRLGGLAGTGVAERPQHPLGGVGEGGGRVGDPGDRGAVGAVEVVAGQLGPGSGRDAVAAAGSGEDECAWGAAVGELAGDGVGDLAGERDDADAGGALGPVLVAAAELAGLVADLEDLQAPGGEVDPVGAQAEQLPGAEAGPTRQSRWSR